MSVIKKILGSNTDQTAPARKKADASTVHLDKDEVMKALGDKSNYNKLPETVQLDKNKVRAIIEAEKKAAAEREAAAKKAASRADSDS